MWIIAYVLGIPALIFLSITDVSVHPNFGWAIVTLLIIEFSSRAALKKDVEKNGFYNNTLVTKTWISIGIISEILVVVFSIYTFIKL